MSAKILFRTSNRRGLGHLMRGLNIATSIKEIEPSAEILFFSRGECPADFDANNFTVFTDHDGSISTWSEVVRSFDPSVVVYDTMLPNNIEELLPTRDASIVYIMRKCAADRQAAVFEHWSMRVFRTAIVPHTQSEFVLDVPPKLVGKTHFVGPIARQVDQNKVCGLAQKYALDPAAFNLLSTPGGGGFVEEADAFFDFIERVHERLLPVQPNLNHLVILGPKYPKSRRAHDQMQIVTSEPNLVHLLPSVDLVISAGGYNTVTEIRLTKTPAVFLPSPRSHDDQLERVLQLQTNGLASVSSDGEEDLADVVELCLSRKRLQKMKNAYSRDLLQTGNDAAARLILEAAV